MLTAERLRELLHYDPETGVFTRRVDVYGGKGRGHAVAKVGDVAGCLNKALGYVLIGIDGTSYLAHRLAWLYVHGIWPPHDIDHVDGCRRANMISNLRLATRRENLHNQHRPRSTNTSGTTGVQWNKNAGKWHARIGVAGKEIHLGTFDDMEDAAEYRELAEAMLHPRSKAAARLPAFTLAEWQAQHP